MRKPKRKLKPMDMATYRRLKKKGHCFDTEHPKTIVDLMVKANKAISECVTEREILESLKVRMAQMIDLGLHEEARKTSWSEGFHEGQAEAEERFIKEKACFEKMHKFSEGKVLRNLNFGEVLSMFTALLKDPMFGIMGKISVLVPGSMSISPIGERDLKEIVRSIVVEKISSSFLSNTGKEADRGHGNRER
jgi:hypothetical protein